jgi:uncharacterized protein YjbI with pentapeptide repeats
MSTEQLKEILEKHKKWLNNEDDGIRANLKYANLRNADLMGANLRYASLMGANLKYANLRDADLRDADLSGANLSGANLMGANLRDADLKYANLRDADLRDADLSGANLSGAIGNNKEVKSLQLEKYDITILVDVRIHIGCQNHTVEQWENFTDEEISEMDDGALEWWKEWKEVILKVAKEIKMTGTTLEHDWDKRRNI